jgi:hypothetical protein
MRTVPTLSVLAPAVGGSTVGVDARLGSGIRIASILKVAIALLVVANLGRIPVMATGGKDAPIFLNDLLVVVVVLAGGLACLRTHSLRIDSVGSAALAFAAVGGLSTILAIPRFELGAFEFVFSIAYLVRWLTYFGIYLVVINCLRRTDVAPVWGTLQAMVLVFAGFGILQSIFLPGFAQIVYPDSVVGVDWDYQGRRLVSSFLDPNFAGMLIAMILLVLLAQLSYGVHVPPWRLLLLFTALLLTVSRSAVLAFLTGMIVIWFVRGISRRVVRAGLLVGVLLIPFLPSILEYAVALNKLKVDASALGRVVSWMRGIELFADHWLLGIGFNTFGFVQQYYGFPIRAKDSFGMDGGLLFIAVMTGVVGVTLYTAMVVLVLRRCRALWRDANRVAEERGLALGVAAATAALLVHSVFLNSLMYPFLLGPLWILWALSFLVSQSRHAPGEGAEPGGPDGTDQPGPAAPAPAIVAIR